MVGQADVVRDVLICLIAGGHALLEGVPGLGKTMLVRTLAEALELRLQPHPVHARPDAGRHHRHEHPGRGSGGWAPVRVSAGSGLRQPRAGRRDQPRHAEDAVGAAGGHGREDGHGGQRDPPPRRALLRPGDPESAGDGRNLSPPRGPARSLLLQAGRALSERRGSHRDRATDDRAGACRRQPRWPMARSFARWGSSRARCRSQAPSRIMSCG